MIQRVKAEFKQTMEDEQCKFLENKDLVGIFKVLDEFEIFGYQTKDRYFLRPLDEVVGVEEITTAIESLDYDKCFLL